MAMAQEIFMRRRARDDRDELVSRPSSSPKALA